MRVIGILGGVASGKSLVAKQLQELGAWVLDADRAGHEVLEEPEVRQALRGRWGEEVFHSWGEVDRAAIARIVFGPPPRGPRELSFLEQLTHPRIGARLRRQADDARRQGATAVVLDAALMLEAGWDDQCDTILFVAAPRSVRLQRARQRGWSEEQFAAREAAQKSLEDKRQRADQTIDNSGTAEQTAEQVCRIWQSLSSSSPLP
jgi:dephospho-CoA kinase